VAVVFGRCYGEAIPHAGKEKDALIELAVEDHAALNRIWNRQREKYEMAPEVRRGKLRRYGP
jgi:retron-type reverse transcriptase